MIYLDYNATTPLAPEVMETMLPYLTEHFGNPSSIHAAGRETRAAIDNAREFMAEVVTMLTRAVEPTLQTEVA